MIPRALWHNRIALLIGVVYNKSNIALLEISYVMLRSMDVLFLVFIMSSFLYITNI